MGFSDIDVCLRNDVVSFRTTRGSEGRARGFLKSIPEEGNSFILCRVNATVVINVKRKMKNIPEVSFIYLRDVNTLPNVSPHKKSLPGSSSSSFCGA